MPSRQDQLHSHQFMVQRVVSALVLRETDPPQSPFRQAASAIMASVLVAVIVAAGFGIYGVFTNRGDRSWRNDGTVVVEKGTGAVFVWRNGKLHPVLNLASAYLASSSAKPSKFEVSSKSLEGVPRGETLGIPFLPDALPNPSNLVGPPWSVCSVTVAGQQAPISAVVLGGQSIPGKPVTDDQAFMVRSATPVSSGPDTYMLWRGKLFEASPQIVANLAAAVTPTRVSPAFIKGVTLGPALEPPFKPSSTGQWPRNPAWQIGHVLRVTGFGEDRFAVVRENDLAYVNQFQAAMLGASPLGSYSLAEINQYAPIADLQPGAGVQELPDRMPTLNTYSGTGLCSVVKDESGNSELRSDVQIDLSQRPGTAGRSSDGTVYADYILVPHGRGAIVASGQTYSLVAADGVRYAAASLAVLGKLGYENRPVTRLPSSLISLLPEGPGLDPKAALVPVTFS